MTLITDLNWGFLQILFLIIIFVIGFAATRIILPYIIRFAHKKGWVGIDIHKNSKPQVAESGGLAIVIGFTITSIFLMIFFQNFVNEILIFTLTVILAGAIGFVDDRKRLKSRYKILLTLLTGGIIFIANFFNFITIKSPTIPFLGTLRLTILYPILAPLVVTIFANTVNMLEGYNGEGSGTSIIAFCFLFVCSLIWNSAEGILFTVMGLAVVIPFFLFNRYPSKVFPGDTGTLSIGVMFAGIALFASLEVAVFCALLIHIFNSFYVLYSAKGFFESSEIQESRKDVYLLDDDLLKASNENNAALTIPRLILAKGSLKEPQLVKNIYVITVICGFFSIIAVMMMAWTIGQMDILVIILTIIILSVLSLILLYRFKNIRGIVILMTFLLIIGYLYLLFIELVIMPNFTGNIFDFIPVNLLISIIIVIPGFILWYYLTIKYFKFEIRRMSPQV